MARKRTPKMKDQIRKAAIRIISEVGFHNCTTDKIANEAGVSVGTIYNYFADKNDILSYIFEIEQKKLRIYFKRIKKSELSVPDKIKYLVKEYYKFIYENKKLAMLLYDEGNKPVSGITEGMLNYTILIHECVKELLIEGVNNGSVRDNIDLDIMASVMIGGANSIAFMGYLNLDKIDSIFNAAPDNLYNIFQDGIFT